MRFEIYRSFFARQWRWRLLAANNRKLANSGESFRNKADCIASLNLVRRSSDAPIIDEGS